MSSRNTQWENVQQPGQGAWFYDQEGFTYDQELSVIEQLEVFYNGLGNVTVWTNIDLL
jgi:hypothetical protein